MNKLNEHTSSESKLIICPTPIGNLGDVSARMRDALESSDAVFAEDTRVTAKLLGALGIKKSIERLDEATMSKRASLVLERVKSGQTICYCSDAGMPGVSDPGLRLVALAHDEHLPVVVIPGPVAAVTAYVASGCTNQHFYFGAFLPRKESQRIATLESLRNIDAALVFYESPNRLVESLDTIAKVFPKRMVSVCRELTKLHEEVVRDNAISLYEQFKAREENAGIKGEIAIVIDGQNQLELQDEQESAETKARELAANLLAQGLRSKDVCKELMQQCGLARNAAYEIVMKLKSE